MVYVIFIDEVLLKEKSNFLLTKLVIDSVELL